jgi:hypothetical protein
MAKSYGDKLLSAEKKTPNIYTSYKIKDQNEFNGISNAILHGTEG